MQQPTEKTKPNVRKIKGLSYCDDCQHMVARLLVPCECICHENWKEDDDRERVEIKGRKTNASSSI